MALFKSSSPEKTVQRDIDAATKIHERLSAQIVEFEQAITHHAAAAKRAHQAAGASLQVQARDPRE